MKKICIKNFENLRNIFDKINYIDANEIIIYIVNITKKMKKEEH